MDVIISLLVLPKPEKDQKNPEKTSPKVFDSSLTFFFINGMPSPTWEKILVDKWSKIKKRH